MGMTISTIQIQNRHKHGPEQFIKALVKYMKSKNLVPATEETAQFTYYLALPENSGWATLSSEVYSYDMDSYGADIDGIASAAETCCVGTCIFDSDVAVLNLYDYPAQRANEVLLGRVDMYGAENVSEPSQECWQPLLTEGRTWQELMEVWNTEYVFEEEVLAKMAPLLGMDIKNIMVDYTYWDEIEPENTDIIKLFFKQ